MVLRMEFIKESQMKVRACYPAGARPPQPFDAITKAWTVNCSAGSSDRRVGN